MNYFELHVGDYDKATAHLTACEDGIYGRLLRRYYDTEAPLCADVKALQRFMRARSKEEMQAVQAVLEEFFTLADDGWHHKRCDDEIQRYRAKSQKARESVSKRWAKRDAEAMPTHTDGTTEQIRNGYERNTDDIHRAPVPRLQTPDTSKEANASSARGLVGKALKAGGVDLLRINLSDPRIQALIDQGATPDEWEGMAREAVAKGIAQPVGWICTALQGRRAEAASIALAPASQTPANRDAERTSAYLREQDERDREAVAPPPEVLAKLKNLNLGHMR